MRKLSYSSNRRRWFFCLVFLLAATLSVVGPTRAVSGLVAASVVVTEAFTQMLAPETAGSKRQTSAAPSVAPGLDEATISAFSNLIGAEPSESAGDGIEFAAADETSNSAGVSQTATQSAAGQFGGGGAPRGARTAAGSSGGPGGLDGAGFGGFTQDGAIEDAIAEQLGSADLGTPYVGSEAIEFDDPILGGPFATTPTVPISESSGGGAPRTNSTIEGTIPFGPAASLLAAIPGAGGADTDGGDAGPKGSDGFDPLPPTVVADLLDDLGLPSDVLAGRSSLVGPGGGTAEDNFSVAQIPEPSSLILVSLGLVAMGRRRFTEWRSAPVPPETHHGVLDR